MVKLLFYCIAGFVVGMVLFFGSFRKFREKRMIENTPTSKVRSLAMGRVEVYGSVLPDKRAEIVAPFSRTKCCYCDWKIEEYKQQGKSSRWVTSHRGVLGDHFYLQDDTGTVLVDPEGAEVDIPVDFRATQLDDKIRSYLDSQGIAYRRWFGNRKMRFTERYLVKDDKVYIMGFAGDNPFVEDATSDRNEKDIMIQKKGFYYISDRPEKEVLKKYVLKVAGGMIGGGALSVVCLFIIFAITGIL